MVVVVAAAAVSIQRGRGSVKSGVSRPSPVAVVNGAEITADDLEIRLEELLPSASYHGRIEPDRLLSLKRAALDALVIDELIYQEARASGRQPSRAAVDEEWAAVVSRFESPEEFAAALADQHLTERAFRDQLAKRVTVREARLARTPPAMTDADVIAYYREHAAKFKRPERVRLLQILLRADPADPASWVKAERRARSILAKLSGGADFGSLARAFSEDEFRVKDGDMGFVHRGRLDEEFEAAVFSAPVGRPAIARSLHGFQVFTVLERQDATQLSLEEARPIIVERVQRQRRDEATRAWHGGLLSAARVEIRDPVLRATRPASPAIPGYATPTPNRAGGGHP